MFSMRHFQWSRGWGPKQVHQASNQIKKKKKLNKLSSTHLVTAIACNKETGCKEHYWQKTFQHNQSSNLETNQWCKRPVSTTSLLLPSTQVQSVRIILLFKKAGQDQKQKKKTDEFNQRNNSQLLLLSDYCKVCGGWEGTSGMNTSKSSFDGIAVQ